MATQEKAMTTHDVANRLVELCRHGKIDEAQEELFADDVTSTEAEIAPEPHTATGKHAVMERARHFSTMIEEHHESHISEPVVAGNWFSLSWSMDVTMTGKGRQKMEEICVYHVKNGKIASEEFFYSM